MKRQTKELFYHFHSSVFRRSKGHNYWQTLSYRDGNTYYDELTDTTFTHEAKKKKDKIESIFLQLPHARKDLQDRKTFFEELAKLEHVRKDSQLLKEFEISLPLEFSVEQRKEVALKFSKAYMEQYQTPVYVNLHKLASHNPHAHLIVPLRPIDKKGEFGLKVQGNDKARKEHLAEARKLWADVANDYAKTISIDAEMSEKSYKDRGINKRPQKHLPVRKNTPEYIQTKELNRMIDLTNRVEELEDAIEVEVINKKINLDVKKRQTRAKFELKSNAVELKKEVITMAAVAKEDNRVERIRNQIMDEVEMELTAKNVKKTSSVLEATKELKQDQEETVYTKLQARYEQTHERTNQLKKKLTIQRDNFKQNKMELDEKKLNYEDKRYVRKDKIANLKLDNKSKKAELKATPILTGYRKRRELKEEIKKNKVSIARQSLAMKREQREMKKVKQQHRKEAISIVKSQLGHAKSKFQTIKQGFQADRAFAAEQTAKRNANVVSLKDFKQQKEQKLSIDRKAIRNELAFRATQKKEMQSFRDAGARVVDFEALKAQKIKFEPTKAPLERTENYF